MKRIRKWNGILNLNRAGKRHLANGMHQNNVSEQLKDTFYKSIGVLAIMFFIFMAFTLTITIVNKSVFEVYGSGQGEVGSLELKFYSLHSELRYLVYNSTAKEQAESIDRINKLSEILLQDAKKLNVILTEKESKEVYESVIKLLDEYIPIKDEIIQYEKEQGKYNSMKLYSSDASKIAEDLESTVGKLFAHLSKQGASFSNIFLIVGIAVTIIALFIVGFLIIVLIKRVNKTIQSISEPLVTLTAVSQEIAEGNLHVEILNNEENEIGVLAKGLSNTVEALNVYVLDIADKLQHIVDNDLAIELNHEYAGDFKPIQNSLVKILDFLNDVFRQIGQSSFEVSVGAMQVSEGAMSLAEGTSNQNAAIQEISDSILEISTNAKSNETLCETADKLARSAKDSAEIGKIKMDSMIATMAVINDTSNQISVVLQTINDIADQTNLLALNAQIEAARAGEAGKGFTVVANEVAKLADKCSAASKQTEKMIKATLEAVRLGDIEVKNTAQVLKETEDNIDVAAEAVNKILEETNKQQKAVEHVLTEITSISSVVRLNSETAKESAAASQQLTAQSDILRTLLHKMKLRECS
jgi:methyl-accepting chemotaxis protein